jgi:hypothetical protein
VTGVVVGLGVTVGLTVGLTVGVTVGLGVALVDGAGVPVEPPSTLHETAVPLTVAAQLEITSAGPFAVNPKVVVPLAGSAAFHPALAALMVPAVD